MPSVRRTSNGTPLRLVRGEGLGRPNTIDYITPFPHKFYVCPASCAGCCICNGGLGWCVVCKGFEGQLLADCPGAKKSSEALDACYSGQVTDLSRWRSYYAAGLRRRRGKWVAQTINSMYGKTGFPRK